MLIRKRNTGCYDKLFIINYSISINYEAKM